MRWLLIAAGPVRGGCSASGTPRHGELANLASTILRLTGTTSIAAAALRHPVRQPSRPWRRSRIAKRLSGALAYEVARPV